MPLELMYGVWWFLYSSHSNVLSVSAPPLTVLAWLGLPRTVLRLALDLAQTLRHLDDHILHESCHRACINEDADRSPRQIGSNVPSKAARKPGVGTRSRRPSRSVMSSRGRQGQALSFGAWRVCKVVRPTISATKQ